MNKKLIRLTESDLHRIVKESVNRIMSDPEYYAYLNRLSYGWDDKTPSDDPEYEAYLAKMSYENDDEDPLIIPDDFSDVDM
jgi:hypothetical protein